MTAYRYRAARPDGEALSGVLEAHTAAAAADVIQTRGLFLIEIRAEQPGPRRPARADELAAALSGLAALLDAGLPLDRALDATTEGAPPRLAAALELARTRVREGAPLSRALDATGVVPPAVLGLLAAGERTGKLAAAVARAALEQEREAETRARIRAALTYPAFLAFAGGLSLIAIAGFVVPRFAALLDAHGAALPGATRALLAVSAAVPVLGPPLAVGAVLALALGGRWARTPNGRLALHAFLLATPLTGPLRLRFATSRTAGMLSGLLDAGVPMMAALELAASGSGDAELARRIGAAREDVNRGERVAVALDRHAALSPVALRLARFGDRAGRLAAFLAHAARLESRAAERALQRAVSLVEPLLILAFGAAVAFVAAALLQAVYSVRPGS